MKFRMLVLCMCILAFAACKDGVVQLSEPYVMAIVDVAGLEYPAVEIAIAGNSTCAALENGEVYCWGENTSHALGATQPVTSATPLRVEGFLRPIVSVDAILDQRDSRGHHVTSHYEGYVALDDAGTIYAWGAIGLEPDRWGTRLHVRANPLPMTWFTHPAVAVRGNGFVPKQKYSTHSAVPTMCALFEGELRPVCWHLWYEKEPEDEFFRDWWQNFRLRPVGNHYYIGLNIVDSPAEGFGTGGHSLCGWNAGTAFCMERDTEPATEEEAIRVEYHQGITATVTSPDPITLSSTSPISNISGNWRGMCLVQDGEAKCQKALWGVSLGASEVDQAELGIFASLPVTAEVVDVALSRSTACVITVPGDVLCWGATAGFHDAIERISLPCPEIQELVEEGILEPHGYCDLVKEMNPEGFATAEGPIFKCSLPEFAEECYKGTLRPIKGLGVPIRQLAIGADHMCGITDTGGVKCWGRPINERLGVSGQ